MKVPLKIRIFMRFFYRKVLLTNNLAKRKWEGSRKMLFFDFFLVFFD
jgi:hypothetical protein